MAIMLSGAMPKRSPKPGKREVPEAGQAPPITHNPFASLRTEAAETKVAPSSTPSAPPEARTPKSRGRLVLRRETKHRGGKAVVVVAGLRAHAHLAESEIATLAQHLKQQLGCGGTVERVTADSELVLQGDQPARVAELLRALGFRVEGVTA